MVKNPDNPFSALDKSRFPKDRRREPAPEVKPTHVEPLPQVEDPEELFSMAMTGVATLSGPGGRKVAAPVAPAAAPAPVADQGDEQLRDLVSGVVEFTLEHTDEFILAQVKGISPTLVHRLRSGLLSPEAHLDMHGLNALQAFTSLAEFLREHYLQGRRCVLLIPGRGKNSPEGYGVLREKVQQWLTRDPFKRVVLAFCTAQPRHGGAGALYVLLRKYAQSRGKILWERTPTDSDLF